MIAGRLWSERDSISVSGDARVRGDIFFYRGEYRQAIEAFDLVVAQGAGDGAIFTNRGAAYAALGEAALAIADYDRAAEFAPEDATIYNNRGLAHAALGDYTAAMND